MATVVGVAIVVVAGWAFFTGFDALLVAPWGYPLFGRPTLAGEWAGTFTTPSGIRFALYLELERARDSGGAPESDDTLGELIAGHANWCDDHGRRVENHSVYGSIPPFSGLTGSADSVAIQIEAGSPPPVGLLPTAFDAQWRADSLTLKPRFSYWTGSAFQYSSTNPDQTRPMSIVLGRGGVDAYRSACAGLGSG